MVEPIDHATSQHPIPYITWGHLLRFDPDEIDRWLAQGRVPAER